MRRILVTLFLLSILAAVASAENQNDVMQLGAGGQRIFGISNEALGISVATDGDASYFATDRYGRVLVGSISDGTDTLAIIPLSSASTLTGIPTGLVGWYRVGAKTVEAGSTTTVINITAHGLRVGDMVVASAGTAANIDAWSVISAVTTNTFTLSNALPATPANTDTLQAYRAQPIGAQQNKSTPGAQGALNVAIDANAQVSTTTGLLHLEDSAHVSADAGAMALSVRNDAAGVTFAANGDYQPIATGPQGQVYININRSGYSTDPVRAEDEVFGNGESVMMHGGVMNEADTTFSSTTQDVIPVAVQRNGGIKTAPNYDASSSLLTCSGCTTTQTGADLLNFSGKCLSFVVDMTNVGTGSITCEIDGKDLASGKYYAILTGAAITTNSTNVYKVCPGLTASANAVANDFLPRSWRVKCTANNANATTYTAGASIVN